MIKPNGNAMRERSDFFFLIKHTIIPREREKKNEQNRHIGERERAQQNDLPSSKGIVQAVLR